MKLNPVRLKLNLFNRLSEKHRAYKLRHGSIHTYIRENSRKIIPETVCYPYVNIKVASNKLIRKLAVATSQKLQ